MTNLTFTIDPETFAQLKDAIKAEVLAELRPGDDDGYLNAEGAAEFLACPVSRIRSLTSAGALPVERDGSRVLYSRAALREYVRNGGAKRGGGATVGRS